MFISSSENFSSHIAGKCADLINQAYDQYDMNSDPAHWQLQRYAYIEDFWGNPKGFSKGLEPFGFVATDIDNPKIAYIVFRGTSSVEDWMTNAAVSQEDHAWGKVESGFNELYLQLSRTILPAIAALKPFKVYVCGHSLGGALATLCAADLHLSKEIDTIVAMYSFASPRVGDSSFSKNFSGEIFETFRIVNTEDIVPTLPTPVLGGLNYTHVGDAICFTGNTGSIVGNHSMSGVYSDMFAHA